MVRVTWPRRFLSTAVRVGAAEEKGGGDGCGEDYYDGWEGDVDADAELAACLDEETLFVDSD